MITAGITTVAALPKTAIHSTIPGDPDGSSGMVLRLLSCFSTVCYQKCYHDKEKNVISQRNDVLFFMVEAMGVEQLKMIDCHQKCILDA